MGVARTLVLGALIACGGERRDPPAPPPAPIPAARAPAVAETTPRPCPTAITGPIDRRDFLCAAQLATPMAPIDLGAILARLPSRFSTNVTLKHGARRVGERGHVQDEIADSPTASAAAPRIVMWDQTTGFSITYDGVTSHRLGMLSVDPTTNAFSLSSLGPQLPTERADDCRDCHGPDSRPIWPMYPDWPGFVGSDNDEVTRDTTVQRDERRWLLEAREAASAPGDRLAALFAPAVDAYLGGLFAATDRDAIRAYLKARVSPSAALAAASTGDDTTLRRWLGLELHATYPYRANHELALAEASRALFHRPNSRAGMLYNRLAARRLMTRIRATAIYAKQPALVALTVMDCGWPAEPARATAYAAFAATAKTELAAAEMPPPDGDRILVPVLLASLGLRVRDVDIRLAHRSTTYDRFDRAYKIPTIARTVMDIGYIAYPSPRATVHGASLFWTSYFDGSASLDELLALAMLEDLGANDPTLAALVHPRSLTDKYGDVTARLALDRELFADMDRLGRWIPLPYPEHLGAVHHREVFTKQYGERHRAICERLRTVLRAST